MRGAVLLVALGLVGCGSPKDPTRGAKLELADARLVVEQADGVTHVLQLKADGAVTFDNEPVVTLRKDGQIAIGGKLTARLTADYTLHAHQVATNVMVLPTGVFQLSGEDALLISEDGKVTGSVFETMDHPRLKLDGAKVAYEGPPAARQALLVGFAAFVTDLRSVERPH